MSRIGKQSIALPAGVTVAFEGGVVTVKGGKGELKRKITGAINVTCEDGHVHVVAMDDQKQTNALHGLYRALIADMVKGVSEGFTKALEIKGVGWKGAMQGGKLVLNVGFSHPLFRRIWELAVEIRDTSWPAEWRAREAQLLEQRAASQALGEEDIRQRDADMDTIHKLEEALKERLDKEYNAAADEFSSGFIRNTLLRSDNRALTDLVARLTADKVVLSRMYPKVDERAETCQKLPLAVNTLKSVLLKEELQRIAAELAKPMDSASANALMNRYLELKQHSMEFDKYNGEIVITP